MALKRSSVRFRLAPPSILHKPQRPTSFVKPPRLPRLARAIRRCAVACGKYCDLICSNHAPVSGLKFTSPKATLSPCPETDSHLMRRVRCRPGRNDISSCIRACPRGGKYVFVHSRASRECQPVSEGRQEQRAKYVMTGGSGAGPRATHHLPRDADS